MEKDLQEVKSDVKELRKDVIELKVLAAENTVSLNTHMSRTRLNEERIKQVENWLLGIFSSLVLAAITKIWFL